MSLPSTVEEPILVQAQLAPDHGPEPEAFSWRDRIYHVVSMGRRWSEPEDHVQWLCYLVTTDDSQTYELRLNAEDKRWFLWKCWQRTRVL